MWPPPTLLSSRGDDLGDAGVLKRPDRREQHHEKRQRPPIDPALDQFAGLFPLQKQDDRTP